MQLLYQKNEADVELPHPSLLKMRFDDLPVPLDDDF